jgi:NAD(P)-dependent dehydrogenase (short-subunit alcohol dehydrogenase family)
LNFTNPTSRQVAILLQKQGALLALNDYDSADSLDETIRSLPIKSVFSRSTYPTATASAAIDWIAGLVKIHPAGISYIFNCAGIHHGLESSSYHYLVKRHLSTLIHVTRATAPHLTTNASYVNISRVSAQWLQGHTPPKNDTDEEAINYAIQHGIVGFSKGMAQELQERKGARMNMIATKYVDQMEGEETEERRVDVADEVADAIMYLFSEKSQDINGSILDMDEPIEKEEEGSLYW